MILDDAYLLCRLSVVVGIACWLSLSYWAYSAEREEAAVYGRGFALVVHW